MSIPELHAGPRMSQAVVHGSTIYLAGQVRNQFNHVDQPVLVCSKQSRYAWHWWRPLALVSVGTSLRERRVAYRKRTAVALTSPRTVAR